MMDIRAFRHQHELSWRELEAMVAKRRQSFRSENELSQFTKLYRKISSDLAYAQTYFPGDPVTVYLNQLVAAAHNRLYRQGDGGFKGIWQFYCRMFPLQFRACGLYILVATAISLAGLLYGYIMVSISPLHAYQLLPPSFVNQFNPAGAGPHQVDAPVMSSVIMTHNIGVAISAFVGGITLGLFTIYALWQNGLILGILAAVFQSSHRSLMFWSLIVPHGVTELLAIFIAGGAGLLIGHKMVAPGPYKRGSAVVQAAKRGAQLMMGTVPMFVIAGTIEGFLTPSGLPMAAKYAVAATSGVVWILYFSLPGRVKPVRPATTAPA